MDTSVTCKFVLLAINKGNYLDTIMDYGLFGGTFSLGLYELEKNGVLEITHDDSWKDDILLSLKGKLPENLKYLSQLYEVVNSSAKKTISDIFYTLCFDITGKFNKQYLADIVSHLTEQGDLNQEIKTGFLKKERTVFSAVEERVKKIIENIRWNISAEDKNCDMIVLSKVLQKTGLLNHYFSKEESNRIKNELDHEINKSSGDIINNTIKAMDSMFGIIMAAISTTVL